MNKFDQWRNHGEAQAGSVARQNEGGAIAGSDALGNAGFKVGFHHVPSAKEIYFKAFISAFQESYASDWASETVFGRPDALYMYKNTSRSISMSIKVPAATISEGYDNLARVQQLVQFLYPTYTNVQEAQTISQSPLIRLKVMNLITSNEWTGDLWADPGFVLSGGGDPETWGTGLLGVMSNLAVSHNLDNPDIGVFEVAKGTIVPKMIEITFDFNAIHEIPLGWDSDGRFSSQGWPYAVDTRSTTSTLKDRTRAAEEASTGGSEEADKEREEAVGKPPSEQSLKNRIAKYAGNIAKTSKYRKNRRRQAYADIHEKAGFGEIDKNEYWKLNKSE